MKKSLFLFKFLLLLITIIEYLENSSFTPLFVSICFNEVTLGPELIHQLEKKLAPFFTRLKRIRFIGVYIPQKNSSSSFQNTLAEFSHLTAIDAQKKYYDPTYAS